MRARLALVVALTALSLAAHVGHAHADARDRPLRIAAGAGPAIPLQGGNVQVQIEESLSYSVLSIDAHPGLFLGVMLGQGISDGLVILEAQARVGFEAQLWGAEDLELLASAHLGLGAGMLLVHTGFGNDSTLGAFDLGVGAEITLSFADGLGAVWLRPVGVDFLIRDGDLNRYQILAGGRLSF
ncbi:MAG: hypothetical protein K1X94_25225 [Sandaracinaceae bacterium]|nr:hypothetical protein [Sandaracinaceae bacterium]